MFPFFLILTSHLYISFDCNLFRIWARFPSSPQLRLCGRWPPPGGHIGEWQVDFPQNLERGRALVSGLPSEGKQDREACDSTVLLLSLALPPRTQRPSHTSYYGRMSSLNIGRHSIKMY